MTTAGTGNFEDSDNSDGSDSFSGRQGFGGAPARQVRGHGWLRNFALASVISTFALIVLGGVVRVTGSGLGCGGEWPLCDGSIIPPLTTADIIEYSHRLVASAIVGPLILITCAIAWLRYRRVRSVVISATVAVILLLAQGGLGGVTVLTELPGPIVAAHLALAQGLLGCLILVLVSAYRVPDTAPAPRSVSVLTRPTRRVLPRHHPLWLPPTDRPPILLPGRTAFPGWRPSRPFPLTFCCCPGLMLRLPPGLWLPVRTGPFARGSACPQPSFKRFICCTG